MPDHARASDPLVRAIAELREQVDHLIDEQKVLLSRLEEESVGVEFPQASTSPPVPAEIRAVAGAPDRSEPVPRPGPDDPGQRLDALAKYLDRRRRQVLG